jgi:NADPH-dependent 2,4-dienoyl-CoA reductase/sulfur reductase-like enzyme
MAPVVIVGASIAGVRCAQSLRARGYDGAIVVLEREHFVPYDKPPLTKAMLAEGSPAEPPYLVSEDDLAALRLDLRLSTAVVAVDPDAHTVRLDTGETLEYSSLVIATGLSARTLPGTEGLAGVFTVRSAADALGLQWELEHARRAVVVGAGFIGAEFAAAARKRGLEVTIVEVMEQPLAHLLGPEIGARFARLHRTNGVEVLLGARVTDFVGEDRVRGVRLDDGRELEADVVVIGIGASPVLGWLDGSGIPVSDGVVCDEGLRVVDVPDVYAAGDIARWPHALYGTPVRIEHWTNANEHGDLVASSILGQQPPQAQVPYVWSDQYDRRIQIVGRPATGTVGAIVEGEDDRWAAVYVDPAGIVVGAVGLSQPRVVMKCQRAIASGAMVDSIA